MLKGRLTCKAVPLALVHHANQFLITDGYDNRQGITEIVAGYDAVLRLHEKYGIPAHLHLSGTLIETLAWHCPWFLKLVRQLRSNGLLDLIGGSYSENIMPLFSPSFNVQQLNELLWLYRRHLDCEPADIKICWVPERVWDTNKLAPVLTSRRLANGGYRYVLLDDRLLYPSHGTYSGSPRALFDLAGPYDSMPGSSAAKTAVRASTQDLAESCKTYRIAGWNGLGVIPISANLRYWVPPLRPYDWRNLAATIEGLVQQHEDSRVLVYADDLEKTSGVGGWNVPGALKQYDAFLSWVTFRRDVNPVHLSKWLADHPPLEDRKLEAGAFYELTQVWQAGEDYRGWWEDFAWFPYRGYLATAQDALHEAQTEGAEKRLLALASKHLLASTYETAWHEPTADGPIPAPWAKAMASHGRASLVMVAAARWFAQSSRQRSTEITDIDGDGEDEVILRNENLYAVMSPNQGGRLVYLFSLTPRGGALIIGNPTDDWNYQEELNRFMERPPNHPSALIEVGFEHDRYRVAGSGDPADNAWVELVNIQEGSRLFGARKSVLLAPNAFALVVCYRLPESLTNIATEACLSPDYYRLLREGGCLLRPYKGRTWKGFRAGNVAVWVARAADEATHWAEPARFQVGHGCNLRLQANTQHFHMLVGSGPVNQEHGQRLIHWGKTLCNVTNSELDGIPRSFGLMSNATWAVPAPVQASDDAE